VNLYGFVANDAIGRRDFLGRYIDDSFIDRANPQEQAACKCGPDITDAFYDYLRSIVDELKSRPSEKDKGMVDGLFTLRKIGINIDFFYRKSVPGCGTGFCKGTVWFSGRCVRATVVNNILFGVVAHSLGVLQNQATIGADIVDKQHDENGEQEGAYDIGYDFWGGLSRNPLVNNNELDKIVNHAKVLGPIHSPLLWLNSASQISAPFRYCEKCGDTKITKDDVSRIGYGWILERDEPIISPAGSPRR
jgi:hypothetical protein